MYSGSFSNSSPGWFRMKAFIFYWIIVILTGVSVVYGQTDSLLSLQRIFLKPYLAGTRPNLENISPDGNFILYQWDSTAQDRYRYWIMSTDGTNKHMLADTLLGEIAWSPDRHTIACTRNGDVFLTDTSFQKFERLTKTEASEYGLRWSPDGKLLAFRSDKKIFALQIGKTGMNELIHPSEKDSWVNLIDFAPDGRHVLFSESNRSDGQEFIVPKYTGKDVTTSSFKSGIEKTRFGIAPVDTGSTVWIKLPDDRQYENGDASISPDGKNVFIERFTTDRKDRQLFRADTDSGKAVLIFKEHDDTWIEAGLATTKWMPDGKAIVTTSEQDGWNHLYMMSPDGSNKRKLTDGDWEVHWFDISADGKQIFFQANKDDHHQWQLFALNVSSKQITRLTFREGTYENPILSKDGKFIVANYSNFNLPTELVRIPIPPMTDAKPMSIAGEIFLTANVPGEFHSIRWVTPDIVHFKARDGATVPLMIYKPQYFDSTKQYPVVVFVHGAGYLQNVYRGWSYYYRETMFNNRLVQQGYIVIEVDYRGSAGYGRDFRTDVAMHLGGKDLDDEIDALEYLKHLGYIDSRHVGIYGGSYGGFLTLMGLFTTDAYACGAALRAVTSWENYYHHNAWYTEPRLGKPEEHPDAYRISSPMTYADSLKKPLLILHGMSDDNVFFQDAVQLIAKLQKANKHFELMIYPDEAHSFSEPTSWLDEYARIEQFFNEHLLHASQR